MSRARLEQAESRRRQPLLKSQSALSTATRYGEVVGGATSPLQSAASYRRPTLQKCPSSTSTCTRIGEVVGGTAAECAAVFCCCPCGLMNLLVLAFYKVPAGLCRRAIRNKRREELLKKGLLRQGRRRCTCGCEASEIPIHPVCSADNLSEMTSQKSEGLEKEVMELEKEMWDMFYTTGFWRSPSTRDASPDLSTTDFKSRFYVSTL